MQTLSLPQPIASPASGRLSWRMVAGALRGDALAAFPPEAFEEDVVVQRFLGRQHILLQRPEAIRHILVDNPQNYSRLPAVYRVLRPMFGRGLFDGLAAPDPGTGAPPDPEKLGDQVATIVVAGHETTAAALFWSTYLLARHQGDQERVAAEVLRLRPTPENAAEILPQLTY